MILIILEKLLKKILFLNIMPQKAVTELDIARMMAASGRDVVLIPMKIAGQTYKTTPMEHMQRFYLDFETLEHLTFDGLIITGAPVEHLPFEQVRYWQQLCRIIDWAKAGSVRSTLYICWGAQAGLYYNYGVPKQALPAKRFGIYRHNVPAHLPSQPLRGLLADLHPEWRKWDRWERRAYGLSFAVMGVCFLPVFIGWTINVLAYSVSMELAPTARMRDKVGTAISKTIGS